MSENGKKILPPRVPVISNAIFNSETISSSNFQEINQVVASDQVSGARGGLHKRPFMKPHSARGLQRSLFHSACASEAGKARETHLALVENTASADRLLKL